MAGQSNAAQNDKRRNDRVPADRLPDCLKKLTVRFGDGGKPYTVETIDASPTGLSFLINLPVYSIQNYELSITAGDASFCLRDEMVYAKPLDHTTSRVSVQFTAQPDLEKYRRLIQNV